MKTNRMQLLTAPVMIAILILSNSFKPLQKNCSANGGGAADGIAFSFNVVGQKDGAVVGHMNYGDNTYEINWAKWMGGSAIFCTTDGYAFYISDNGKPSGRDWISDPVLALDRKSLTSADFFGIHCVSTGNIQVKD